MSVDLRWIYSGAEIETPFSMLEGVAYPIILRNVGTSTATNVGFYLALSTVDPLAETNIVYPSTRGISIDLYELLSWGAVGAGNGYILTQSGTPYVFTTAYGNSSNTPVPLTIGSGSAGDEIGPGEEINFTVSIVANGQAAQRKYVNLEVVFDD